VLARTGIEIHDDSIVDILGGAGCKIETQDKHSLVKIPHSLVEEAISQAPKSFTLYDQSGNPAMTVGKGKLYARTSSGAISILDIETEQRREPTVKDAADAARLADALVHIDGVSTMAVQPADVSVDSVDLHAVKLTLENTSKPLGYVCLNECWIDHVLAMFSLVAGGEENLCHRPYITALAESTSPLKLVSSQLAVLKAFASRGLPLTVHAHPIAGVTAPVTLAGELVITHAEVLALVTIVQLIHPGSPVMYGMSSSVPDMRKGVNLSGAVEIGLLGAAVATLAKYCELPCIMSAGIDASRPGARAMMERLTTMIPPALAGIDLLNLSTLETKMTFCPWQLVIDDVLLSTMDRYLQGISVDGETLALDLIHEMAQEGKYISEEHTLRHYKDELLSLPGWIWKSGEGRGSFEEGDLPSKARKQARTILAEHRPTALPEGVKDQLGAIVAEAEVYEKRH
jgi:trimethylamine--corrinoid protein Co-methyltransferase